MLTIPRSSEQFFIAGNVYYFLCDKWFAVDEGDGRIERELVALDNVVRFTDVSIISLLSLYGWYF